MTNRDFDPVTDYHQQQYQQNPNATVSILSDQDILLKLKNQNKLPYINTSNYGTSIHSDHSSESGSSITGSSNMFEDSPTHSHPTASSQSLDGSHTTCSQHSEWTSENGSQIYSYSKEDKNQS